VRKSTGHGSTGKPTRRKQPMARGMCQAEVTSSQRWPADGLIIRAVKSAFSKVSRDCDSSVMRSLATPSASNRRAAVSDSGGSSTNMAPVPPVNTTLALGRRRASTTASVKRSAASLRPAVSREAPARPSSAPPSTMMPVMSPPDRSARGKRFSSGAISRSPTGVRPPITSTGTATISVRRPRRCHEVAQRMPPSTTAAMVSVEGCARNHKTLAA
jgi:hypothetical protein